MPASSARAALRLKFTSICGESSEFDVVASITPGVCSSAANALAADALGSLVALSTTYPIGCEMPPGGSVDGTPMTCALWPCSAC